MVVRMMLRPNPPRLWGKRHEARPRPGDSSPGLTGPQSEIPPFFQLPHSHVRQRRLVLWIKRLYVYSVPGRGQDGCQEVCAPSQKPSPRAAALRPRFLPSPSLLSSQSHKGLAPGGPHRLHHHTLGSDFKGGFPNSTLVTALSTQQVLSVPCSVPRDKVSSLFLQNEPDGSTHLTLSPAPKTTLGASDTVKHSEGAQETSRLPHTLVSRSPQHCLPHSHSTYLAPRLPLMMGAVTTLLPFMGWLMTDSGTVIRVGSFPYREKEAGLLEGGGKNHHPASPRGRRSRGGSLRGPVLL